MKQREYQKQCPNGQAKQGLPGLNPSWENPQLNEMDSSVYSGMGDE